MSGLRVLVPGGQDLRKGRIIHYVGEAHLELLSRFGALPVMLPALPALEDKALTLLDEASALLIVEGEDVDPDRYRPSPESRPFVKTVNLRRDRVEFPLVAAARERGMPIMGICRGAHLIAVAFGGTLFTDVVKDRPGGTPHIDYDHYDEFRHPATFVPGTWLAEIFGQSNLEVNSYHHQGVRRLPAGFQPLAYAADGLIEAYHDPAAPFLVGLQFHPERMQDEHPGCARIFERFVAAAGRHQVRQPAL